MPYSVLTALSHYSTHLADLKALTHDVLYETYRTEKLSRTVHADTQYVYIGWYAVGDLY